jgi:hypothetical protein
MSTTFEPFDLFAFVLNLINSVVAKTQPSKTGGFFGSLVPNGTFGVNPGYGPVCAKADPSARS